MAKSKLLPSAFTWTIKGTHIPYFALILGSVAGFTVMLIFDLGFDIGYSSQVAINTFNAALMGSYFTFMVMFISYIIFSIKYPTLNRRFRSPFGLIGGIIGVIAFCFFYAGLIGYSYDEYGGVKYFSVFVAIATVYYFAYARYHECFSTDEQNILLVVYVIKGKEAVSSRLNYSKAFFL